MRNRFDIGAQLKALVELLLPEEKIVLQNRNYQQSQIATPTPTQRPQPTPTTAYSPKQGSTAGSYSKLARNPEVSKFNIQGSVVEAISQAAQAYGVPPELLFDIALQESGFNPTLKNPDPQSTASGLFQFTRGTLDTAKNYSQMPNSTLQWPQEADVFDPQFNATLAAYLIKNGQLGRWDASKPVWGKYYSDEELEPFYSQTRR